MKQRSIIVLSPSVNLLLFLPTIIMICTISSMFSLAILASLGLVKHSLFLIPLFSIFIVIIFSQILKSAYKNGDFAFEIRENEIVIKRCFITKYIKSISYSNIKEIGLHQSVIQRIVGVASIIIYTHATGNPSGLQQSMRRTKYGNISDYTMTYNHHSLNYSGAVLYNLKEYMEVYELIKSLIH